MLQNNYEHLNLSLFRSCENEAVKLTVLGCMNVMKSTEKWPTTPRDLHDSATFIQASFNCSGSTDD